MGIPFGLPDFTLPRGVMRRADRTVYASNLGASAYAKPSGMNAWGDQATFDILGDGQIDQGLRVTLGRGAGRNGDQSNGYAVSFATGAGAVAVDHNARTIVITMPDDSALSFMKATIDADAALSSEYFGGETGSSTVADASALEARETSGGTKDPVAWLRFGLAGAVLISAGSAAPANDAGSRLLAADEAWHALQPGESLFMKRQGAADVAGSVELWLHDPAPFA